MRAKAVPKNGTDSKVAAEGKHIVKADTSTGTPAVNRLSKNRRVAPESRSEAVIAGLTGSLSLFFHRNAR